MGNGKSLYIMLKKREGQGEGVSEKSLYIMLKRGKG